MYSLIRWPLGETSADRSDTEISVDRPKTGYVATCTDGSCTSLRQLSKSSCWLNYYTGCLKINTFEVTLTPAKILNQFSIFLTFSLLDYNTWFILKRIFGRLSCSSYLHLKVWIFLHASKHFFYLIILGILEP